MLLHIIKRRARVGTMREEEKRQREGTERQPHLLQDGKEDLEEECENAMGADNVQVVNMNENNVKLGQAVDSRSLLLPLITAAAAQNLQMVRGMVNTFRMPVPALQQILGLFSFKEIGILRRVHPHWDELAGQLLNVAHYRLIQKAQHLLTDCQRRVTREPRMAQPVKLLTRLHVHALNPVDGMRAFMDEGVLYFPYGAFLDQAYSLLSRIDLMIENNYFDEERQEKEYNEADNLMDKLAEITKKAVLHFKQWVEPEAEKRMSELYRVSAQQRLQRTEEEEAENERNYYCGLLIERLEASNQLLEQYSTPSTSNPSHQILQPVIIENASTGLSLSALFERIRFNF
uniref:Uncharacterized protein n=1 Tax=Meloidogyne incognita TaxID=6306 RepID=A0A914MZB6_MELIC